MTDAAPGPGPGAPEPASQKESQGGALTAELHAGIALHQAGRIDEAETVYRGLLRRVPHQPNALHLLGLIESQRGNPARGVELIGAALPALANAAQVHLDLGCALRLCGRREEAIERFREAVAIKAD